MPSPKSAESLLEELDIWGARVRQMYGTAIVLDPKWLRSALASYALYLEGKMPKKKDYCRCICRKNEDKHIFNGAIEDCRSILREEAEKLTNV